MIAVNNNIETTCDIQTLNPILFAALQRAFPVEAATAVITNAGQRRRCERSALNRGAVEEYGEEIKLNCPFCGDTRGRMRINYTYDPALNTGRWYCYNEKCHENESYRTQLAHLLQAVWQEAKRLARNPNANVVSRVVSSPQRTEAPITPELPAGTVPIIDLPGDHPAAQYLLGRGFDIQKLWDDFQIGFSEGSRFPQPAIGPRIVIPIVDPFTKPGERPTLLGWQARQIPGLPSDLHSEAKYLTMQGFRKSHELYTAIQGPLLDVLFIVEGVTDAWRIGRPAVALLGKAASSRQIDRLVEIGQFSRLIFVALDQDAQPEQQQLVDKLRERFARLDVDTQVLAFDLPEGCKDIGECTQTDICNAYCIAYLPGLLPPPAERATPVIAVEPPALRPSNENDLCSTLLEHATGRPPEQGTDLCVQIQALGIANLYDQLELPLQPVLRAIEQRGVLINNDLLREIVCQRTWLVPEAVRLRNAINPGTGRVHMQLNSLGTKTGRITACNYALQSLNRELRAAVVPGPDKKLIYADYGQFEWRIAAALSGDPLLLALFSQPEFDLYTEISKQIFGDERASQRRDTIKKHMMEFLYSQLRLYPPTSEGQAVSRFLAGNHAQLVNWLQAQEELALRQSEIHTPFGRRVRLPQGDEAARKAVNYIVQATAADVFKFACLAVEHQTSPIAQIILPLHDALLIECNAIDVGDLSRAITRCMESPIRDIPVRLSVVTRILDRWE